jgi:hypothetical protein
VALITICFHMKMIPEKHLLCAYKNDVLCCTTVIYSSVAQRH